MAQNKLLQEMELLKRERDQALKRMTGYEEAFKYIERSIVRTMYLKDETRVYINCSLDELNGYKGGLL
jgi:hypothetical protein